MSAHIFSPEVAKLVGLNAAVIYQNLKFWVEKNTAEERHFHEGRYWTRASRKGLEKIFDYLSPRQIRTALDKLLSEGLIVDGNFNKVGYDRTKWYSVTDAPPVEKPKCICPEGPIEGPESGNRLAGKGQPIPDVTKDITEDLSETPVQAQSDLLSNEQAPVQDRAAVEFDAFWKVYPRKAGQTKAKIEFRRALKRGVQAGTIIDGAKSYAQKRSGQEDRWTKKAENWLKEELWKDESPSICADEQLTPEQARYRRMREWAGQA